MLQGQSETQPLVELNQDKTRRKTELTRRRSVAREASEAQDSDSRREVFTRRAVHEHDLI